MASRIYLYHAHGVALGGTLTRPFVENLEAQAMASLPISGGYGSARVDNFRFKNGLISFDSATTQVTGSLNASDGSYNTLITTTVEGLKVLDMLTADRVTARLASKHLPNDTEPRITPVGSLIENLRVGGCPINVELDANLFGTFDTFQGFKEKFEKDKDFEKEARRRFLWGKLDDTVPEFLRDRYSWCQQQQGLPESKGVGIAPCSLVKDIDCGNSGARHHAHVLIVPQFGKIFIGEIFMKRHARRLTMLRMELGSAVEGTLTVSGNEGNGTTYP